MQISLCSRQRAIALAPDVSHPLRLVDNERADVELAQSGRGHEARLACPDDDNIRVAVPEFARSLSSVEPVLTRLAEVARESSRGRLRPIASGNPFS